MLVVSDTSVLLNLRRVSAEGLVLELFREVWVPPTLAAEVSRLVAGRARVQGLALPDWVRISSAIPVPARVQACPDLDPGASEAFSLALELRAETVLTDEAAGRRAAIRLGVPFIGIAGVLLRARKLELIPAVRPMLSRLGVKAGLWLSPEFEAEVLRLARES